MEAVRPAPVARAATASSGGEWRLPLLTGLALAVVTAVPYAYAYAAQSHGQVFMGFFFLGDDANTYLAKMRQGWEGAWAWQNRYTTESSPSAYLFMFWILLGHLAAILHLPLIAVFHLARVGAAFALMGSAWLFITHFIEDRLARRFGFFFVAIGLGMGLVIQALGHPEVQRWTFHSKNALPPEGISLFFALAPQLLLALTGIPGAIRRRTREDLFLVAWLVLLAAILYLPNPAGDLRRRFLDAIYLPLGVLAARGMYEAILPRLRSVRARALVPFSYVAFASIGSAFLVLAPLLFVGSPMYSVSQAEYDGLAWLGNAPAGTVLCMPGVGLFVPAYSPDVVYVGHYDETFDYFNKTQQAFDLLTGRADLVDFVHTDHIRYVVWTADLRSPPPTALGPPAYDSPNFKIYRVY